MFWFLPKIYDYQSRGACVTPNLRDNALTFWLFSPFQRGDSFAACVCDLHQQEHKCFDFYRKYTIINQELACVTPNLKDNAPHLSTSLPPFQPFNRKTKAGLKFSFTRFQTNSNFRMENGRCRIWQLWKEENSPLSTVFLTCIYQPVFLSSIFQQYFSTVYPNHLKPTPTSEWDVQEQERADLTTFKEEN